MAKESFNFVIVGGGGYIGFHVGVALWERGHNVTLFDIAKPDSDWIGRTSLGKLTSVMKDGSDGSLYENKLSTIKFLEGSLLNTELLRDTLREAGTHCVVHCASYGMSGLEQMPSQWDKTELVNVTGTENVIKACKIVGIRGLVYTSSYNVVFGGQELINGDESLPYFPLHKHVDHYSRTKAVAERLVIASDSYFSPEKYKKYEGINFPMRSCALRLAGVMGLGEKRHLPRIVKMMKFAVFRYGYGKSLQQFITLKNVVQAHVKAAEALLLKPEKLGGQVYFVSDDVPINSFEFLQPLRTALGYGHPKFVLPMWILWTLVYMIQLLHTFCGYIHHSLSFTPLLAPAEVYKTAVTHYFSCDKARKDFGYSPENPNDISEAILYFCEKQKLQEGQTHLNVKGAIIIMSGFWIL